MKTDRFLSAKLVLISLPILLTFGTKGAIAQITPANDGTGTIVNGTQQLNITGGTQAGGNLFHSFQQFGVNAGQTANFLSNPNTQNILGRVTGGNASLINGVLQVSGSNANLYLINPAGIVFGKNASLNVPAAFTATTANGIGFGNGQWFNAIGSNNYAALTGNPNSFGFVGLSGSLINAGNLSVNPGQSIALVGGTVVNTGTISAPGGNITIAAIPGEKLVRIGQDGTILSLDLPTSDKTLINAPIATPLSLPELLTGGTIPSAMGVVVEDGVVKLKAGSATIGGTLSADGVGNQNGGNVIAYADNYLNFTGTISVKGGELGGNGGFVDTSGKGQIDIGSNAKVVTTAANGLTGNWLIDPADLTVVAVGGMSDAGIVTGTNDPTTVSTIGADTIVAALNLSNVELKADNSITVNAAIDASANPSRGNLSLNAPTANLNQAIKLEPNSDLSGTAITVNVGVNGTVQNGIDVASTTTPGTVNLKATTYKQGEEINISKDVTVKGTGPASTIVSGENLYRVFNINSATVTFDSLTVADGQIAGDSGGGINNIGPGVLTVNNSNVLGNTADSGGGIFSQEYLTLTNSNVSGNTASGTGTSFGGGGIGISAFSGALTITNSTVSGNTANGGLGGGGITSGGIASITSSTISGNVARTAAGGGIVGYSGGTIANSTITNNTAQGTSTTTGGGGIYVTTGGGTYTTTGGTFTIANSIVAGNIDLGGFTPDLGSETASVGFTNGGNNIIGANDGFSTIFAPSSLIGTISAPVDPKLAQLGNYGGLTQTHALLPGSLAIDAGNATTNADQRGVASVGTRDIGAYESKGFALVASNVAQSTTVNTPFTDPLKINLVETAFNRPLPGATINFTTPTSLANATLNPTTAITTDSTGTAQVIATANTKAGTYTIQASSTGLTGVTFTLTNIAGAASTIAATSGSGQTATVDQSFANSLVATVKDQFGNPIQGSTVTFVLPTSGASGVFAPNTILTTDVNGEVSIGIKANAIAGSFTTTGTIDRVIPGVDFNLTNTGGTGINTGGTGTGGTGTNTGGTGTGGTGTNTGGTGTGGTGTNTGGTGTGGTGTGGTGTNTGGTGTGGTGTNTGGAGTGGTGTNTGGTGTGGTGTNTGGTGTGGIGTNTVQASFTDLRIGAEFNLTNTGRTETNTVDAANSIVRREEILKLPQIGSLTGNILCVIKGSKGSIKKVSSTLSQNDPYKGISACTDNRQ